MDYICREKLEIAAHNCVEEEHFLYLSLDSTEREGKGSECLN